MNLLSINNRIMSFLQYLPKNIKIRHKYLDRSLPFIGKDIVKIFTGQRRAGKSYMLYQMINYISNNYPDATIIYINKELPDFRFIKNYNDLMDYAMQNKSESGNYLFIDEVQEIADFEKALRGLMSAGDFDIWCSSSNAQLLSGDISGLFSGRSVNIHVNTLNFTEFIDFHDLTDDYSSLNLYLQYGGLPYLRNLELKDEIIFDYLKNIYSTILYKDIISRHNIRNTRFLEDLVSYIADNTGSLVTSNNISKYLKSQLINISTARILEYLKFMTDAFFLIKIPRADLKGKRFFEIGEKYYFNDIGLRNVISGYHPNDIAKILENIVLLHMLSSGYSAFVGFVGNKEIDFVFEKNNKRIYIQVAYQISDEKVYQREFGNLKLVRDNYPKFVVSLDPVNLGEVDGIMHIQLIDFLKSSL